jgi:hypothetical protein
MTAIRRRTSNGFLFGGASLFRWLALAGACCPLCFASTAIAQDGLRRIEAPRFGVTVRAPLAWPLVEWCEDDRAFVLSVPQEKGSPDGYVRCELTVAPERLADYFELYERQALTPERAPDGPATSADRIAIERKLVSNTIQLATQLDLDEKSKRSAERLVTVWEHPALGKIPVRFEVVSRQVRFDTLYTFTLLTDEAHFAAYRADFEDLLASAEFRVPETGLEPAPGGYWLQPRFQFALRPPDNWRPAFGSSNQALWFARGAAHGVFVDQFVVRASPTAPLDLKSLRDSVPMAIVSADPAARVLSCELAAQGQGQALETVVETVRDHRQIVLFERRFAGVRRNYELRVTCDAAEFKQHADEIRKSFNSFREIADPPMPQAL